MIDRLTQFLLLCLCVIPVWLIVRRPWKRPLRREIALGMFVAYIAALLLMALEGQWAAPARMLESARYRISIMDGIHLHPFRTITHQLQALPDEEALTQLLGNTLLFMPWGFFLPLLWRRFRRPWVLALMCLGLTCCIEFTQLFIRRTVDVDDLILNFAASMIGAGIWWLCHRRARGKE